MKIAILAHGYSGATLPLAKHFADKRNDVDCYYLCWHGATQMESMEYGKKLSGLSMAHKIDLGNTLYKYLPNNVTVRIIPLFNPNNKLGLTRMKFQNAFNSMHVKAVARQILNRNYDYVNVILYTEFDYEIFQYLVKHDVNCCVTYHEVLTDLTQDSALLDVVNKANQLNTPIIVHSQKTKEDLLRVSDVKEERIHLIHFGLFESFKQYDNGKIIDGVGDGFLLYLGFIKPYKGLKYLYEAVQKLSSMKDLKIVVAGGGYDAIIDKMRVDKRFIIINRFITNAELAFLMKSCKGIICPYIGASQSGLVQTAMFFEKPVIATRVGAFSEIIKDGVNGYLSIPADADDLALCIERFYKHDAMYDFTLPEQFQWEIIVQQYIELFFKYTDYPSKA